MKELESKNVNIAKFFIYLTNSCIMYYKNTLQIYGYNVTVLRSIIYP